jgi:hypothetical protein
MTNSELVSLIDLCRKQGVRRVKIGDVELEFGAERQIDPEEIRQFSRIMDQGVPTDDEVLFHSAPGYEPPAKPEPALPKTTRQRNSVQRKAAQ